MYNTCLKSKLTKTNFVNVDMTKTFLGKEKKYPAQFSIHVIERMLKVLYNDGKTKRTNLAGKSGMNYNKCMEYVNLLLLLKWLIYVNDDNNGYHLVLTEQGAEVMKIFENI